MQIKNDLTKDITFEDFKTEVLNDYTIAVTSRECSLLGRREVLTGKSKIWNFWGWKRIAAVSLGKSVSKW